MARSRVIEATEFDGYFVVVSRPEQSLQKASARGRPFGSDVCGQPEIVYGHTDSALRVFVGVGEPRRRYGSSKKPPIPEAILHRAWRNAGLEHAQVRGRDGHTYRIVYGGKPAGSVGPDFTDAVIERDDGTVFRGDIEIHVRESDWRAHGHHNDARYNGVVLHVVAAESIDSKHRPALKATGVSIPLLALNWKSSVSEVSVPDPVILNPDDKREVAVDSGDSEIPINNANQPLLLAEAGLERFHSQAAGFALDIDAFGEDQACWLGVMGALGYPKNKRAFRTLATRVDWKLISSYESSFDIERLLVQAAGLEIPTDDKHNGEPRKIVVRGSAPSWVRPWGRPANAPATRIAAISALVPTWSSKGGIAHAMRRAVRDVDKPRELATLFRPESLISNDEVKVIGGTRAAEIVVNVLLPGVFAMATLGRTGHTLDVHLKNRAVELFSSHPKLAGNSVTKEAKIALGISYAVPEVKNARDQQGLIALYRELVRHGIKPRQPRLPGV